MLTEAHTISSSFSSWQQDGLRNWQWSTLKTVWTTAPKGLQSVAQSPAGGKSLVVYPRYWYGGQCCFNIYSHGLDNGTKCTLSKFADDTQLGRVADTQHGCPALQDISRLKNWAEKALMKLNKRKWKVLHLRRNNPRYQYIVKTSRLESSFARKNHGVLVESSLPWTSNTSLWQKGSTVSWAALGKATPAGPGR